MSLASALLARFAPPVAGASLAIPATVRTRAQQAILFCVAAGLLWAADAASAGPSAPEAGCPAELARALDEPSRTTEEDSVVAPEKQAWEAAHGGLEAARPHVRARLRGWPSRLLADAASLPADDHAFLARLARDTWRGLDALTDRESGLPVDNVRLQPRPDDPLAGRVGDYTNVSSVGLHLIAIVAARELGLLSSEEAAERVARILGTLERLETHNGLLFNYYDTTSLERTSDFLSFVDLAWLDGGLIVVRGALPELAARSSALLERSSLASFYDPERGQMSHGYWVRRRERSRYHYGVLYTEARLGVLLAIGRGDAPADAWFRMVRTFPAACTGQTLPPHDSRLASARGQSFWTGLYEWQGLRYVPSWGGSLFEALMPTLVLDELRHAPRSLGPNGRIHAVVQERYAREVLGYPVWGLSPSATPGSDRYGEYGVRVLGSHGYAPGPVSPHAAALALAVAPEAATATLRELARRYPIYGDYGFYDAVLPSSGEVATTYLALDQSMLFIAAANHLGGGRIPERFAADPLVRPALGVLAEESFFD